jgi:hypothetical protein
VAHSRHARGPLVSAEKPSLGYDLKTALADPEHVIEEAPFQ